MGRLEDISKPRQKEGRKDMKYQAQIRHINGDLLTTISDDDLESFREEVEKAREDLSAYVGQCNDDYVNDDLYLEEV